MGDVLDMITKKPRKLDCQNESVVHLRDHLDTPERRTSAAGALGRCIREMQQDFGDDFALIALANEIFRIKHGRAK